MNPRQRTLAIAVLITAASGAGCATVAHGPFQEIRVESVPSGADVRIDTRVAGVTPTTVRIARGRTGTVVHLSKDGFTSLDVPLKRGVSRWLAVDAIALNPLSCQGLRRDQSCAGMLLGTAAMFFGIDLVTGSAFTFPKTVKATLAPIR